MNYLIKHTSHPLAYPETIAEVAELTASAVADAINAIPAHKAVVVLFETDFDNPGYADVFTARGEIYSVEPIPQADLARASYNEGEYDAGNGAVDGFRMEYDEDYACGVATARSGDCWE